QICFISAPAAVKPDIFHFDPIANYLHRKLITVFETCNKIDIAQRKMCQAQFSPALNKINPAFAVNYRISALAVLQGVFKSLCIISFSIANGTKHSHSDTSCYNFQRNKQE